MLPKVHRGQMTAVSCSQAVCSLQHPPHRLLLGFDMQYSAVAAQHNIAWLRLRNAKTTSNSHHTQIVFCSSLTESWWETVLTILVLIWGYAHTHTPSLAWLSPFPLSICVQRHTDVHHMCICLVWECGTAIQGLKQLPWWSLIRVLSSLVIKLLSKHWRLTFTACRIVALAFWGLIISEFCRRHTGQYSVFLRTMTRIKGLEKI